MNNGHANPPTFLIVLGFIFWWPLGLGMLLYKVGLFDGLINSFRSQNVSSTSAEEARMKKYKIMASGAKAVSIPHLASAVGVSYDICIRELQKMVSTGQFGATAYINYSDRVLVLSQERSSSYTAPQTNAATPNYAAQYQNGSKVSTRYSSGKAPEAQQPKAQPQSAPPREKKTSRVKAVLKQMFGSSPGILIGVSVVLFAMGIFLGTDVLSSFGSGFELSELVTAISSLLGGAVSLAASFGLRRRATRAAAYLTIINGRDFVSLSELVSASGEKEKTVLRDLEIMIEKGLFGEEAYIDKGAGLLILKAGAAPKKEAEPEPDEGDEEAKYRKILKEIRQVNDDIPDEEISARIDEMEDLTSKIFKAVQEKPEKLPQIKSFMSYYLPTALKLLHSYAEFDQNGAGGENVETAKADIERILDMLVEGFRKQLDKLYEADAMDVSADINVLETMLKKDGLSDDGSGFQVMGGH